MPTSEIPKKSPSALRAYGVAALRAELFASRTGKLAALAGPPSAARNSASLRGLASLVGHAARASGTRFARRSAWSTYCRRPGSALRATSLTLGTAWNSLSLVRLYGRMLASLAASGKELAALVRSAFGSLFGSLRSRDNAEPTGPANDPAYSNSASGERKTPLPPSGGWAKRGTAPRFARATVALQMCFHIATARR
jgi:hypothetical protein